MNEHCNITEKKLLLTLSEQNEIQQYQPLGPGMLIW